VTGFEIVVFVGVLLAIGGGKLADRWRYAQAWLRTQSETWASLARAHGLEVQDPSRSDGVSVRARRGSLTVTIKPFGSPHVVAATLTVDGLPKGLRVSRESVRTQAARLVGARDFLLGDPDFDAALFLEGDPLLLRAAFDEPTRRIARRLLGVHSSDRDRLAVDTADEGVTEGTLRLRCTNATFPRTLDPPDFLRQALALADRLSGEDAEERLAAIVRSDRVHAVRARALELLSKERPGHPSTLEASLAACRDVDPLVRVIGAAALGPHDGQATLLALAPDATVPDEVSSRAVAALGNALPVEQARAILEGSIGAGRTLTATACVARLVHEGAEQADVIAWAVQRKSGVVSLAVAETIGRFGTTAHVPVLRAVEQAEVGQGALAAACRRAIASIQERAQGARPGQLSLASGGGDLSLAEAAQGRLDLAKAGTMPPPGQD
jgi:hypothetical protein